MRLYAQFKLSEAQQERYETALSNYMSSNTENPYESLSADDRIAAEANILEGILDDAQFELYKAWAHAND